MNEMLHMSFFMTDPDRTPNACEDEVREDTKLTPYPDTQLLTL
jgi:hypothetical protein